MKKGFWSIRNQLTAVLLLVAIIPMTAISIFINEVEKTSVVKKEKLAVEEQIKQFDNGISLYFQTLKGIPQLLSEDGLVKNINDSITSYISLEPDANGKITMDPAAKGGNEAAIYEMFSKYANSGLGISEVCLGAETNGGYVQYPASNRDKGYDARKREWYMNAAEKVGETIVSDPKKFSNGEMGISIMRAFNNDEGKLSGVICISVFLKDINEIFSKCKIGENGYLVLTDKNGVIIADTKYKDNAFKNLMDLKLENINSIDNVKNSKLKTKIDGREYIVNAYTSPNTGWNYIAFIDKDEAMETAKKVSKINTIAIILAILFIIIISIYISGFIAKPLVKLSGYLNEIGSGDLTTIIDNSLVKKSNEIGSMARSLQLMQNSIIHMVKEIISQSSIVNDSVREMSENLIELNSHISDVSATTEELSAGMEETAASTQQMNSASSEIECGVESIFQKAQEGTVVAGDISKRANALKTSFMKSQNNAISKFNETKLKLKNALEESKSVRQINSLSESIMEITSQTNLVALNAAIEAARVGEAGRGFAVVAEEIRNLAESSNTSVVKIKNIAETVVNSVNNLVESSNGLLEFMSVEVNNDYKTMLSASEQYNKDSELLDALVNDFSKTAEELHQSMQHMARAIDGVANSTADGAAGTLNIAEKSTAIVERSSDANMNAENSKASVQKLMDLVSKFKV